jgi:hypothetical protein
VFIRHWCRKVHREYLESALTSLIDILERLLGTRWTSEDIFKVDDSTPEERTEVRVPLAMIMNMPDGTLHKWLKKYLHSSGGTLSRDVASLEKSGEIVGSMMDLRKDEFYQVMDAIQQAKNTAKYNKGDNG